MSSSGWNVATRASRPGATDAGEERDQARVAASAAMEVLEREQDRLPLAERGEEPRSRSISRAWRRSGRCGGRRGPSRPIDRAAGRRSSRARSSAAGPGRPRQLRVREPGEQDRVEAATIGAYGSPRPPGRGPAADDDERPRQEQPALRLVEQARRAEPAAAADEQPSIARPCLVEGDGQSRQLALASDERARS